MIRLHVTDRVSPDLKAPGTQPQAAAARASADGCRHSPGADRGMGSGDADCIHSCVLPRWRGLSRVRRVRRPGWGCEDLLPEASRRAGLGAQVGSHAMTAQGTVSSSGQLRRVNTMDGSSPHRSAYQPEAARLKFQCATRGASTRQHCRPACARLGIAGHDHAQAPVHGGQWSGTEEHRPARWWGATRFSDMIAAAPSRRCSAQQGADKTPWQLSPLATNRRSARNGCSAGWCCSGSSGRDDPELCSLDACGIAPGAADGLQLNWTSCTLR